MGYTLMHCIIFVIKVFMLAVLLLPDMIYVVTLPASNVSSDNDTERLSHCDYFVIIGCTWGCYGEHLKCSQWLQSSHCDYLYISVDNEQHDNLHILVIKIMISISENFQTMNEKY